MSTNCHYRRNKVKVLTHDEVQYYQNCQKLSLATRYFADILGQPAPSMPIVQINALYDPIDLSELVNSFSWAEIVQAIDKSPNNRSPGPDGFTNEF